jgi:uncharacterized protein YjbI with pentapeptide repeats
VVTVRRRGLLPEMKVAGLENCLKAHTFMQYKKKYSFWAAILIFGFFIASNLYLTTSNCSDEPHANVDWSRCDKSGLNFTNQKLSKANLKRANLSNTNFSGTDFAGATLEGANLKGANLSNTNLDKAIFFQANLQNSDLTNASFSGANFSQAYISGTKLNIYNFFSPFDEMGKANLAENSISATRPKNLIGLIIDRQKYKFMNLKGLDFSHVSFLKSSFANSNLENAIFFSSELPEVIFSGSNLSGANFGKAQLQSANLMGANLKGTNFSEAQLFAANLMGANLKGTNFDKAQLRAANLRDVRNLTQSQLDLACGDKFTKLDVGLTIKVCLKKN